MGTEAGGVSQTGDDTSEGAPSTPSDLRATRAEGGARASSARRREAAESAARRRKGSHDYGFWLVALVASGLAAWRVAFVLAGFDLDTDAYGHHAIARQILKTPKDLHVHWVWLPLFHYLEAIAVWLGATLQTVRLGNVAMEAAIPLVLHRLLRRLRSDQRYELPDPAPTLAALLAALSPLCMQMGTTGQTEPLFALLILGVIWGLTPGARGESDAHPIAAGAFLAMAVMVRYEAWAIPPTLFALFVFDELRSRRAGRPIGVRRLGWKLAFAIALPIASILTWATLRRLDGEAWFAFLKGTQNFAVDAMKVKVSPFADPKKLALDLSYYPVQVAWAVVGVPMVLAPFGAWRTWKREGATFVGLHLACLAFISYVWLQRGSLGLYRHFMVIVPFYAVMIANGAVAIADVIERLPRKLFARSEHAYAASRSLRWGVVWGIGFAVCATTYVQLDLWMTDWRDKCRDIWPDRLAAAAYLRSVPANDLIFCDEATLEVFSGLDRNRFDRRYLGDDDGAVRIVAAAARRDGETYVASWAGKMTKLQALGHVAFRPAPLPWEKPGEPYKGVLIVKITREDVVSIR
jgi:hypothetical protein